MRKTNTEKLTSQSLISRRALLVGGVQAALVGVLGARMHYLPITRKSQILMCAPVRVAKFTTDSTVLRSLSEEMAKSTQDCAVWISRDRSIKNRNSAGSIELIISGPLR